MEITKECGSTVYEQRLSPIRVTPSFSTQNPNNDPIVTLALPDKNPEVQVSPEIHVQPSTPQPGFDTEPTFDTSITSTAATVDNDDDLSVVCIVLVEVEYLKYILSTNT